MVFPGSILHAAIFAAVLLGGLGQFLRDWTPFILLFLSYEFLRGLAPILNKTVHIHEMIAADKFLFGFIPSVRLQQLLFDPAHPHWYDFAASVLYTTHFIIPMVTAFIFWMTNKKLFREFTLALIALSFAAFATYVIFPAMPPWLAAQQGYIPHLQKVMDVSLANLGQPLVLPTIYKLFRGDEVAAMPSLHAAYPTLVMLFFVKAYRKKGLLLLPYVFSVWFAVVYLGEHYVIDVIMGALYAVVVFYIVLNRQRLYAALLRFRLSFIKEKILSFR